MATIVYPPTINWDLLYQRPQAILTELAKAGHECIFYDSNPPYKGANECHEPYSPVKGVTVVPPDYPVKEIGDFVLYYSLVNHYNWIDQYKPEYVIYDNLDYPVENQPWYLYEQSLKRAELTLNVSDFLYDISLRYKRPESLSMYVPNGTDWEFYNNPKNYSCFKAPEILIDAHDEGKAVIGFSGVFWENVTNWPLFLRTAKHFKDDLLVCTGSFFNDYGKLPENMVFLGHVKREILPAVMGGFDIGIIPFLENDFTKAMCPLKAFDYLASGLPVVSTPIPEVAKLPNTYIFNPKEFTHSLDQILLIQECKDYDNWSLNKEMREMAKEFDWHNVLDVFIAVIKDELQ